MPRNMSLSTEQKDNKNIKENNALQTTCLFLNILKYVSLISACFVT